MASSLTLDNWSNQEDEPRVVGTRSSMADTDHSGGLAASHAEREVPVTAHRSEQTPDVPRTVDDNSAKKGKSAGKGKGKMKPSS